MPPRGIYESPALAERSGSSPTVAARFCEISAPCHAGLALNRSEARDRPLVSDGMHLAWTAQEDASRKRLAIRR